MSFNFWDALGLLSLAIIGVGILVTLVLVLGLPGKIAYARNHPDAEAINMMGWVGALAVVPWIQAFLWAFKPTDVIDIRRFPAEEKRALEEQAREHTAATAPKHSAPPNVPPE